MKQQGHIAIIGVGTQGSMIAFRNALHGIRVVGYSRSEGSRENCRKRVDAFIAYYVEEKKLTPDEGAALRARISYAGTLEEACAGAHMLIENVPEVLEQKQALFAQLDEICAPNVIFCSNTSSLLMSDICKGLSFTRRLLTFQVDHDDPVRNNYLEMMWNADTADETKAAALAHFRALGFEPIVTQRENKGYSINRVWRAVKKECLKLWANGFIEPAEFDRGWRMEWHTSIGPFQLMDLIGLDTILLIENSYFNASGDESDRPPERLREFVEAGKLGMKTGEGFYAGYDTAGGNLNVEKSAPAGK